MRNIRNRNMKFLKYFYHLTLAFLGSVYYRNPSKKLFVIGVTGTKGKTSSAHLIQYILNSSGKKCALLSSVSEVYGEKTLQNTTGNTMPGRFFIQRFLKRAVNKNCKYAVIEVTSQGVLQNRHKFIKWDGACFTNLHREHLEAHGGFEKYREAKLKFFRYVKNNNKEALFFVNKDDENYEYFKNAAGNNLTLYSGFETYLESSMLPGEINKPNIALAEIVCESLGVEKEMVQKLITHFPGVKGRMEIIQKEPFAVVIDYAYTPESVKLAYEELRKLLRGSHARLITVFGSAGGGRDKWKRPALGEIASNYANVIILTSEEPYDERPEDIIKDIKEGIKEKDGLTIYKITDRKNAIQKAIEEAQEGDVVALMGKGAEPYIHLENKKIPWNEKKIVEEILKEIRLKEEE